MNNFWWYINMFAKFHWYWKSVSKDIAILSNPPQAINFPVTVSPYPQNTPCKTQIPPIWPVELLVSLILYTKEYKKLYGGFSIERLRDRESSPGLFGFRSNIAPHLSFQHEIGWKLKKLSQQTKSSHLKQEPLISLIAVCRLYKQNRF